MNAGTKGAIPSIFFWGGGQKLNNNRCLQLGAYNFGTEANFCMLETTLEPELDGLQGGRSTLTFHRCM